MNVNNAGLALIKQFEGLRLDAYKCPAGVWTIGYGHTGPDVAPGDTIRETDAKIFQSLQALDKDGNNIAL